VKPRAQASGTLSLLAVAVVLGSIGTPFHLLQYLRIEDGT
jgi:hypothetical protein